MAFNMDEAACTPSFLPCAKLASSSAAVVGDTSAGRDALGRNISPSIGSTISVGTSASSGLMSCAKTCVAGMSTSASCTAGLSMAPAGTFCFEAGFVGAEVPRAAAAVPFG